MVETPPIRRRLLGAALRRHRDSLGYRLDDAARILECDRSKISRIESGQRGIRPRDLRDLLAEYGVGEQEQQTLTAIAHSHRERGRWQPYADILSGPWLDYLTTEAAASQIQSYQPQQVPDLLQTQEYARAVTAADPALPTGTQDLFLEAILTRQQLILEERRPDLAVVIGEAALHQVVGGTAVMQAQLARLAEMASTCPQITIQILTFASGAHPAGVSGPLSILRFADAPSLGVVHLPGPNGGIFLDSLPDIANHALAFALLSASALTPVATAQLLGDMAARLRAGDSDRRLSSSSSMARFSPAGHRLRSAGESRLVGLARVHDIEQVLRPKLTAVLGSTERP